MAKKEWLVNYVWEAHSESLSDHGRDQYKMCE